jgi:glutamine amidotransferase
MKMIVIIDYGMGNLGSIKNMFKKIGQKSVITSDIDKIESAEKLILPGVGAFDNAVTNLKQMGLFDVIKRATTEDKTPLMGICLGMQLLTKRSEEGKLDGLGLLDAETIRFKFNDKTLKIPHMGWNTVDIVNKNSLFGDVSEETRFYFVHSYYAKCIDESNILTTTNYGLEFCSSFSKDNIYGVQFHPEKSHKFGMKLLSNFAESC